MNTDLHGKDFFSTGEVQMSKDGWDAENLPRTTGTL